MSMRNKMSLKVKKMEKKKVAKVIEEDDNPYNDKDYDDEVQEESNEESNEEEEDEIDYFS